MAIAQSQPAGQEKLTPERLAELERQAAAIHLEVHGGVPAGAALPVRHRIYGCTATGKEDRASGVLLSTEWECHERLGRFRATKSIPRLAGPKSTPPQGEEGLASPEAVQEFVWQEGPPAGNAWGAHGLPPALPHLLGARNGSPFLGEIRGFATASIVSVSPGNLPTQKALAHEDALLADCVAGALSGKVLVPTAAKTNGAGKAMAPPPGVFVKPVAAEAQEELGTPTPAPVPAPAPVAVEAAKPPPAPRLENGVSELPSKGSAGHARGTCKPCAFVHKGGCQTGLACQFCHLCELGEKKRRKRERAQCAKSRHQSAV